jgi:5'-nucleotidase
MTPKTLAMTPKTHLMTPKTHAMTPKTLAMTPKTLAAGLLAIFSSAALAQTDTITILHTNDLHAHCEPTSIRGKSFGGYARQATLIEKFRQTDPNPILLNAGDTFQGTLYFNVYEGLSDLAFMNAVRYDAMAVGNHEFDRGPKALLEFARNANFPVLAANLDLTGEPELDKLVAPSMVMTVRGLKIGVVGAVTSDLPDISSPGPNVKMLDLEKSVQAAVDDLTKRGIYKVILVSHCGYDVEKRLAASVRGLDVVVGGHSHSFLGVQPAFEGWARPLGDYPTSVMNPTGSPCLVVQAWEWGKVLGRIKVRFNKVGRVVGFDDAGPIPITSDIPEDLAVKSMLAAFSKPIDQLKNRPVGSAATALSRNTMGELIADAMIMATQANKTQIALMNPGGVRAELESGEVTYGEAISVQPFNNTLFVLDLSGKELRAGLEQMIMRHEGTGSPMFVSEGTSYRVDRSAPAGQKILDLKLNGLSIGDEQVVRIVTNSFLAGGGDGITALKEAKGYRYDTGNLDVDALIAFIQAKSPVSGSPGRRVVENR